MQNSDGGKTAEGFSHETNDCTVRALANSTGLSYKESHRLTAIAGRKPHHGMDKTKLDKLMVELAKGGRYTVNELLVPQATVVPGRFVSRGYGSIRRVRRQRVGGISVNEFLWRLPKTGTFYLCCTTHAFAVVDGVLRDPRQLSRAKMASAWQITQVYPQTLPVPAPVAPVVDTARLAEMEEMKRKIARLEEMVAMKKRIAELEKQMGPKAFAAAAGA